MLMEELVLLILGNGISTGVIAAYLATLLGVILLTDSINNRDGVSINLRVLPVPVFGVPFVGYVW